MPDWRLPPCPPPQAGWPEGDALEAIEAAELGTDEIATVTIFRPTGWSVVVVVASDNPDLTRRRLAPVLGDRLCVIESKWRASEVRALQRDIVERFAEWTAYSAGGVSSDNEGQPYVSADVVQVVPSLAEYAESLPERLLVIDAWLAPLA